MIDALQAQSRGGGHGLHILVVDDSSPDGTADVCADKTGLLSKRAFADGTEGGISEQFRSEEWPTQWMKLHADVVFQMDADFSHKPEDVPRLMAAIDRGRTL